MQYFETEPTLDFLDFNANAPCEASQDLFAQNVHAARSFEDDLSFTSVSSDVDSLPPASMQNSPMQGDMESWNDYQQDMRPNVLTVPTYVPAQPMYPAPYYVQVMPPAMFMPPQMVAQPHHMVQQQYLPQPYYFAPQQQAQVPYLGTSSAPRRRARAFSAASRKHNPLKREHAEMLDAPSMDSESSMFADERQLEKKQKLDDSKKRCSSTPAMQLIKGFMISPDNKQCGGKDNKTFLESHVVAVDISKLPVHSLDPKAKLAVRAQIIGYSKKLQQGNVVLGVLEQHPLSLQDGVAEVVFDRLLCKQSSHNCGQKLTVKFAVVDISDKKHPKEIDSIETAEFETITKRGVEKQRQKQQRAKRQPEITTKIVKAPLQCSCTPASGVTGTIATISCNVSFNSYPVESIRVRFGTQVAFNVQYGVNNTLFVMVPPCAQIGEAKIALSFDHGVSWQETDSTFSYIPSTPSLAVNNSPFVAPWQEFVVGQ